MLAPEVCSGKQVDSMPGHIIGQQSLRRRLSGMQKLTSMQMRLSRMQRLTSMQMHLSRMHLSGMRVSGMQRLTRMEIHLSGMQRLKCEQADRQATPHAVDAPLTDFGIF